MDPTNTIFAEFATRIINLKDGTKVKVQLFDTAGQERYRSVVSSFYRKSLGALLVFDLTRRESFNVVERFINDIRQFAEPDCVIFLVGNKLDLVQTTPSSRQVSSEEAKSFATENDLEYLETSAFSNFKVTEAFEQLTEKVYQEKVKPISYAHRIENVDLAKRKKKNKDESCCG